MISWTDVMVRQLEHEQKVNKIEQSYWMQVESPSVLPGDRWQWRLMNTVGGWLVEAGCRMQTHVETARQMMHPSHMAMEAKSNSTQPCP